MSTVIQLSTPIKGIGGVELTELTLNRPTARLLRGAPISNHTPLEFAAYMLEKDCGLPRSSVDSIDGADFLAIAGVYSGFLDRTTGATPSQS